MPDQDEHPAVAVPERAAQTGVLTDFVKRVEEELEKASQERQRLNARPVADTLFVFAPSYPDERPAIKAFARIRYGVTSPVEVSSWDEVVAELERYKEARRLVLFTHGVPGRLQIGNELLTGDELAPRLAGTKLAVTESITFEGCSTMRKPMPMARAAAAVGAPSAIGYTWWHYLLFKQYSLVKGGAVSKKSRNRITAWFAAHGTFLVAPLRGGRAQITNADKLIAELERRAQSANAEVTVYAELFRDGPGPALVKKDDRSRRQADRVVLANAPDVQKFVQQDLHDRPRVVTLRTKTVLASP